LYLANPSDDSTATTTTTSSATTTTTSNNNNNSNSNKEAAVLQDAETALTNVEWSMPLSSDEPLSSNDPFVQAIDAGIRRDVGVALEDLLNPAKVVNLERDLYYLRQSLEVEQQDPQNINAIAVQALQQKIEKKQSDLNVERRAVFRGWLKNIFLGQAVISVVVSYIMANNPALLFGNFGWYSSVYNMDVSIQVLGYWWWWLFVVPSLRSRRPKGLEKKALDWAFLGTPLISLIAPIWTRDTGLIWDANLAVVVAAYAVAYIGPSESDNDNDGSQQPDWLKFLYKSLDFGSGRERGARQ
jgi:hypothetical protein